MTARASKVARFVLTVAFGLGSAGCGGSSLDEDPAQATGTTEQEIIGGGLVPDPGRSGVVKIVYSFGGTPWLCSGVLLSNLHVLTAKHCFDMTGVDPRTTTVLVIMGYSIAAVGPLFKHPDQDLAVIRLSNPFPMPVGNQDSLTGYWRPIDTRTAAQLDGQPLVCAGYGFEVTDGSGPSGNLRWDTFSTLVLRTASGAIWDPDFIWVRKNGMDTIAGGDSGGPCFSSQMATSIATAKLTSIAMGGDFLLRNAEAETLVSPHTYWISLVMLSAP